MLSVIIIAKNEANNIRLCLESISFADEIIVLDSGSQDGTATIAKEFTDKVFITDWQGYGIQKQRALMHATHEWVLNLDADETVSEALKLEIINACNLNKFAGYRIPIRMSFYGKTMRFSASPSRHIRLFKRKLAKYSDDLVHEKIQLSPGSKIGQLTNPIYHHSFRDISHALYKSNLYSSYSAAERLKNKHKPRLSRAFLASLWMFIRCYVLQKGILDGKEGFILACLQAQSSFYRTVKQIYQDNEISKILIHGGKF